MGEDTGASADAMVERVVDVLGRLQIGSSLEEQAVAALQVCHHAELVEALRWATDRLKAVGHGWTKAEMEPVEALLAKIGGDPMIQQTTPYREGD